jgi:MYXO-CTERM domain-containing protein
VANFGHSGATLLVSADLPYTAQTEYAASNDFAPDVVVIMLGTNDSKAGNWANESEFEGDYTDLINHYESLGAFVYAALPPPVYGDGCCWIQGTVVADEIVPHIQQVASNENVPTIDVFTAMSDHADDFLDGVHPTVAGHQLLAQTVYDALTNGGAGGAPGALGSGAEGGVGGSAGQPPSGGNGGLNQGGAGGSGGFSGTNGAAGSATGGATGAAGAGGATGGKGSGGTNNDRDDSSSGCSCQVPQRPAGERAWGLLGLTAFAARWRRRRAR